MKSLSLLITASTEVVELARLCDFLKMHNSAFDEIVVCLDATNFAVEMESIVTDLQQHLVPVRLVMANLRQPYGLDFSYFKNAAIEFCTSDYILQLDADEMITPYFVDDIHYIVNNNDVDIIYIPRINTVDGLTDAHVKKWGWRINGKGYINFPDMQGRIFKSNLRFEGKVHEKIVGVKTYAHLPDEFAILHHKSIDKQERQNSLYDTI